MKTLKDNNFLENGDFNIAAEDKSTLMELIERDSLLLCKLQLIDYSLLLTKLNKETCEDTKAFL